MRERREGPQRQQGFALGYLLSIVLVAVVVVLLAALLERLI
jgi:tetrahydromethanopterin S-methyltransferase subunit F